jgi:tripartite-type tricarboxylate transporter receptor subunit TctC
MAIARRALLLSSLFAAGADAAANDFPTRPVTIVVPFPPGGATDLIARPLGAALQRIWGQPVVLQNRGGAGGAVGMTAGAQARPDGYTALIAHVSYSSIPPPTPCSAGSRASTGRRWSRWRCSPPTR